MNNLCKLLVISKSQDNFYANRRKKEERKTHSLPLRIDTMTINDLYVYLYIYIFPYVHHSCDK